MRDGKTAGLEGQLQGLIERQWMLLFDKQWASGADRWAEFVFCILDAVVNDAPKSRALVDRMRDLQLLEPDRLALLATRTPNRT